MQTLLGLAPAALAATVQETLVATANAAVQEAIRKAIPQLAKAVAAEVVGTGRRAPREEDTARHWWRCELCRPRRSLRGRRELYTRRRRYDRRAASATLTIEAGSRRLAQARQHDRRDGRRFGGRAERVDAAGRDRHGEPTEYERPVDDCRPRRCQQRPGWAAASDTTYVDHNPARDPAFVKRSADLEREDNVGDDMRGA